MSAATMKLADPDTVEITLTINPFYDAVSDALRKVDGLRSETEVDV